MRRYYPTPAGDDHIYKDQSIRRLSIDEWRKMWTEDRTEWFRTLKDRPNRFDGSLWHRAIASWKNDIPDAGGADPLAGVPFLVKDLFDVPGERTTCSSAVLLDDGGVRTPPAEKHAWLTECFLELGAHVTGRTNMNEFAYGLDGRNSRTGNCPHPLDRRRIPGGSSSGSAWAVAAGIVPFALGTDTGGSVRLPAALCGIYGVRLGWSRDRLRGVFPLAGSLDTVGWFTHNRGDMEQLLSLVCTDASHPGPSGSAGFPSGGNPRIAAILPHGTVMDDEIGAMWREVVEKLDTLSAGVDIADVPPLLGDAAVDAYNIIGSSEAWAVHRDWIGSHGDLYDPVVRGLIERGKYWSGERLRLAEETRSRVREYAASLFQDYDFVILPATVVATPLDRDIDGDFRSQIIRLNTFGSLAGLPALSVPVHFDAVRSGGIQILAPSGRERSFQDVLHIWDRLNTL